MDYPMYFGDDSPFPPMPSSRKPSASYAAAAPPLPPSRAEALQREHQLRQQQQQQHRQQPLAYGATLSPRPGHLVAAPPAHVYGGAPGMPMPASGPTIMQPGQLVHSPSMRMPMSPRPDMRPPRPHPTPQPPPMPSHIYPNGLAAAPARQLTIPMPAPTPPPPQPTPQHSHHHMNASQAGLQSSFDAMRIHPATQQTSTYDDSRRASFSSHHRESSSSSQVDQSSLSITLPDLEELCRRRDHELNSTDDRRRLTWCKDVLKYVERKLKGNRISEPALVQLVDQAISAISRMASAKTPNAEALFLRGDMLATGAFPSYHVKDLRSAFNDFELSARMGHAPSWFRIGRDYEVLGDMARARDAYERGCSVQDVGCIYRMGMANLLGQLELGVDHSRAIPLLKEAADLSNVDTPQPSYVYGMLLAGEFNHVQVAQHLLTPDIDPQRPLLPPSREGEARRRIQRAAYFNFAPAQYRMGWLHEYAQLECAFDPLLSVQYYSLSSQGGEVEADLALSKWFLCGAEGCFDKNESLAFTFADKAAVKGLPSAEFAMGYYFEVGVGCEKDLDVAKKWYRKAAAHDNEDAKERIEALAGPEPNALSRKQHEAHVDTQLQRKRTEAKMLSDKREARRPESGAKAQAQSGKTSQALPPSSSSSKQQQQRPPVSVPTPTPPPSKDLHRRMTMRLVEEVAQKPAQPLALQQSIPMPVATPPPMQVRPHGQQLSTSPGRLGSAGTNPGAAVRPIRGGASSAHSYGGGGAPPLRRGSDQPPAVAAAAAPPGRLQASAPVSQHSSARPTSNGGGKSIPVASAPSMGADTKVYETFGEMGFTSNANKDEKDCVIC